MTATAAFAMLTPGCMNTVPLINTALKVGVAKIAFACVPEGVGIDTPEGTVPIESIQPGDFVIGYSGAPVRVLQKHAYAEDATRERFYRVRFEGGSQVEVCDMHRIGGQRARTLSPGKSVGGTTVESVEIYGGVERSYDLLTEDEGYQMDGLPVNSMIAEMVDAVGRL